METTLIFGPMYAGKSKKLIELVNQYNNDEIICFKPNLDTRSTTIVSRDGLELKEVYSIDSYEQLLNFAFPKNTKYIFIDEAQFINLDNFDFNKLIEFLKKINIKHLFVSMLDYNYLGSKFKSFESLERFFANKIHLKAKCFYCQKDAIYTGKYLNDKRITSKTNIIEIEGDNQNIKYLPLCKEDFINGK